MAAAGWWTSNIQTDYGSTDHQTQHAEAPPESKEGSESKENLFMPVPASQPEKIPTFAGFQTAAETLIKAFLHEATEGFGGKWLHHEEDASKGGIQARLRTSTPPPRRSFVP